MSSSSEPHANATLAATRVQSRGRGVRGIPPWSANPDDSYVFTTRGKSVRLDAGTTLEFRLTSSVRVRTPQDGRDRLDDGSGISRR